MLYSMWGGEVCSDAASSFGMWPGLQPHISTCNLSVSPSWPPAPFINSCHQASLWSARLSLKCQRCTQASSSYIFLLFWSFCFPAGQLRQFWPAWPVAGHFQPLPILSPNNLQYIRWGGREESADSLLHISIPELPSHIFFTFPGQQLSLLHPLLKENILRKHLLFAYSIANHIEILPSTVKLVSDYATSKY